MKDKIVSATVIAVVIVVALVLARKLNVPII